MTEWSNCRICGSAVEQYSRVFEVQSDGCIFHACDAIKRFRVVPAVACWERPHASGTSNGVTGQMKGGEMDEMVRKDKLLYCLSGTKFVKLICRSLFLRH